MKLLLVTALLPKGWFPYNMLKCVYYIQVIGFLPDKGICAEEVWNNSPSKQMAEAVVDSGR